VVAGRRRNFVSLSIAPGYGKSQLAVDVGRAKATPGKIDEELL
jgi:hypothetical protein